MSVKPGVLVVVDLGAGVGLKEELDMLWFKDVILPVNSLSWTLTCPY